MKKNFFKTTAVIAFLIFLSVLICLQSPTNIWTTRIAGTDSCVFRYMALLISKGGVVYRDSFDHKGPLIYFLNYLGMQISYYNGIWIIELLSMIATVGGIYKISRLSCKKLFSCMATFVTLLPIFQYFEGGNFTEEYALPFMIWGVYIFLDYFLNRKINNFRLMMCGLMFANVCLLRINMISVWLIFSLAVFAKEIYEKNTRNLIRYFIMFLIGCGIVCIPAGIYLFINGAFYDFIQDYIIFNFQYIEGGSLFDKIRSCFTFISTDIMLLSLGISFYTLTEKHQKKFLPVIYIIYSFAAIYLTCMSGRTYGHYGMALIPVFAFPVSLLFKYLEDNLSHTKLIFILSLFLIITTKNAIKNAIQSIHTSPLIESSAELQEVISIVKTNSQDNDKIFVYGNHNIIYILSERLSASRYSYQFPISEVNTEIEDSFLEDIHRNIPKIVVLQKENNNSLMFEFLNSYDYQLLCENNCYLVFGIV